MQSNGPGDSDSPGPPWRVMVKVEPADDSQQVNALTLFTSSGEAGSAQAAEGSGAENTSQVLSESATAPPHIVQPVTSDHNAHNDSTADVLHDNRQVVPSSSYGVLVPVQGEPSVPSRRRAADDAGRVGPVRRQTRTHGQGPAARAIRSHQRHTADHTAISHGASQQISPTDGYQFQNGSFEDGHYALPNDPRYSVLPSVNRAGHVYRRDGHFDSVAPQVRPATQAQPQVQPNTHVPPQGTSQTLPIGHAAHFFAQQTQATGPPPRIQPSNARHTVAPAPQPGPVPMNYPSSAQPTGPPLRTVPSNAPAPAAASVPQLGPTPTFMPPNYPPPGHPQAHHAPRVDEHVNPLPAPLSGGPRFECALCRKRFVSRDSCHLHILMEHILPAFWTSIRNIPRVIRELPPDPADQ